MDCNRYYFSTEDGSLLRIYNAKDKTLYKVKSEPSASGVSNYFVLEGAGDKVCKVIADRIYLAAKTCAGGNDDAHEYCYLYRQPGGGRVKAMTEHFPLSTVPYTGVFEKVVLKNISLLQEPRLVAAKKDKESSNHLGVISADVWERVYHPIYGDKMLKQVNTTLMLLSLSAASGLPVAQFETHLQGGAGGFGVEAAHFCPVAAASPVWRASDGPAGMKALIRSVMLSQKERLGSGTTLECEPVKIASMLPALTPLVQSILKKSLRAKEEYSSQAKKLLRLTEAFDSEMENLRSSEKLPAGTLATLDEALTALEELRVEDFVFEEGMPLLDTTYLQLAMNGTDNLPKLINDIDGKVFEDALRPFLINLGNQLALGGVDIKGALNSYAEALQNIVLAGEHTCDYHLKAIKEYLGLVDEIQGVEATLLDKLARLDRKAFAMPSEAEQELLYKYLALLFQLEQCVLKLETDAKNLHDPNFKKGADYAVGKFEVARLTLPPQAEAVEKSRAGELDRDTLDKQFPLTSPDSKQPVALLGLSKLLREFLEQRRSIFSDVNTKFPRIHAIVEESTGSHADRKPLFAYLSQQLAQQTVAGEEFPRDLAVKLIKRALPSVDKLDEEPARRALTECYSSVFKGMKRGVGKFQKEQKAREEVKSVESLSEKASELAGTNKPSTDETMKLLMGIADRIRLVDSSDFLSSEFTRELFDHCEGWLSTIVDIDGTRAGGELGTLGRILNGSLHVWGLSEKGVGYEQINQKREAKIAALTKEIEASEKALEALTKEQAELSNSNPVPGVKKDPSSIEKKQQVVKQNLESLNNRLAQLRGSGSLQEDLKMRRYSLGDLQNASLDELVDRFSEESVRRNDDDFPAVVELLRARVQAAKEILAFLNSKESEAMGNRKKLISRLSSPACLLEGSVFAQFAEQLIPKRNSRNMQVHGKSDHESLAKDFSLLLSFLRFKNDGDTAAFMNHLYHKDVNLSASSVMDRLAAQLDLKKDEQGESSGTPEKWRRQLQFLHDNVFRSYKKVAKALGNEQIDHFRDLCLLGVGAFTMNQAERDLLKSKLSLDQLGQWAALSSLANRDSLILSERDAPRLPKVGIYAAHGAEERVEARFRASRESLTTSRGMEEEDFEIVEIPSDGLGRLGSRGIDPKEFACLAKADAGSLMNTRRGSISYQLKNQTIYEIRFDDTETDSK